MKRVPVPDTSVSDEYVRTLTTYVTALHRSYTTCLLRLCVLPNPASGSNVQKWPDVLAFGWAPDPRTLYPR